MITTGPRTMATANPTRRSHINGSVRPWVRAGMVKRCDNRLITAMNRQLKRLLVEQEARAYLDKTRAGELGDLIREALAPEPLGTPQDLAAALPKVCRQTVNAFLDAGIGGVEGLPMRGGAAI